LVIGPGGVFVIDSKQYRGRLQLDPSGRLWHGRYPLAPSLRAVSFEADQAEHTSRGVHSLELVDRDRLNAYLTAIDDLEHQGDQLHRRVLAQLYDFAGEHPARHMLRWKDITDGIEDALDELAHVAHTVEGIILKHA
jgi:uncharacterized protein Yka (UPF0111/DUF47 family)